MPLDPEIQALLEQESRTKLPSAYEQRVEDARDAMRLRPVQPAPQMARQEDSRIPGPAGDIPIRIYRPQNSTGTAMVYFHGGGWVLGDLETHDSQCRKLAQATGSAVIAVDYRRAPEHLFPAAAEDAYAAVSWVAANAAALGVDSARIGVGGGSAGGNLAAVACLIARDRSGPAIKLQWLAYPVVDHSFGTGSYHEFAFGYGLDLAAMVWFWTHYLGPAQDGWHPYASPLRAGQLAGLPRAIVTTAECDVLRDEGQAYAERLRQAGVPVEYRCFSGANHAFLGAETQIAEHALTEIGGLIRAGLQA